MIGEARTRHYTYGVRKEFSRKEAIREASYEMGRFGEKRYRSRRFGLKGANIRQRWLEKWVFDRMVLATEQQKKK